MKMKFVIKKIFSCRAKEEKRNYTELAKIHFFFQVEICSFFAHIDFRRI